MKPKEILVFGASGQIGRHLIRKLTKNNYKVTAVTRNLHRKGYVIKTQGNPGYLEVLEANVFDIDKIANLIDKADICINLIGILFETKNNSFNNIHTNFPDIVSNICSEKKIEQLIHISALGIEEASDSKYAMSKLNGEIKVKKNFPSATILRPSLVYSVDDNFTTNMMSLLNILPIFPLYYQGKTKFIPLHVSDFTEIIFQVILKKIKSQVIECIGPEKMSFKDIILKLLKSIDKKRILLPFPLFLGKTTAKFFEFFMPKPLLTLDQLKLLKYDNIPSGIYNTNFDLGMPTNLKLNLELEKYSFMWKEEGEYSRKNNKKVV